MNRRLAYSSGALLGILILGVTLQTYIPDQTAHAQNRRGRDDIKSEETLVDLNATNVNFTTATSFEWRLTSIFINFTTPSNRTTTISITSGTNSFVYQEFVADNATDFVTLDKIEMERGDEINISIPQTAGGGLAAIKVVKERI